MARQRQVRIINPQPHGAQFTSPKRAIQYLLDNRARIAGEYAIEFISDAPQHLAVLATIARQTATVAPGPLKPRNSPTIDEIRERQPIADSGFGFARYPLFPDTAFRSFRVAPRRAKILDFPVPLRKAA